MKFLQILSIASVALAAPALVQEQETTDLAGRGILIDGVTAAIGTVRTTATANGAILQGTLAEAVANHTQTTQKIVAMVVANLRDTAAAFQASAAKLTQSAQTAAAALQGSTSNTIMQEITQARLAVNQAQDLVNSVKATVTFLTNTYKGNLDAAISAEIQALQTAIAAFTGPFTTLADSLKAAVNPTDIQALIKAGILQGVVDILNTLSIII
ncbi:uncharacterized protein B0I36DRAFT_369457 [Microdochium trichocladiopsis]|uniref:Uncharacterized protein n=1 Tax=Microdochium trichocladiopsis TaxID=1682393 RepID=A0A9P9BIM5_9PEZI|nr:uncharacterized protein B0I36DRAFT_369457 [Microdochium trichocladiopsis]KAH7014505.1 hypothetical protein B0I36DRAFT_369457 [Microdochium trichocladiopsis]